MKLLPVFLVVLLWAGLQNAAQAQGNHSIVATATVAAAGPSCGATLTNMAFGTLQRPSSGSGTATLDADYTGSDFFTYSDGTNTLTSSGTPALGALSMTAPNVTTFTLTASTVPDSLYSTNSSCDSSSAQCGIVYSLDWAESATSTGTYSTVSGTSHTVSSLGGEGTTSNRYYRVGGSVGGVSLTTTAAQYRSTVTFTLTCS